MALSRWASAARAYHCAGAKGARDPCVMTKRGMRIVEACRRRYNASQKQCVESFMDESNSRAQMRAAYAVLQGARCAPLRVAVFDAFNLTAGRCDATVDGRHYPRLLARVNARMLQMAVAAVDA